MGNWRQRQGDKEVRKAKLKKWKKHRWNRVLVGINGPPCPGCKSPTEVWHHKEITDYLLEQSSYYTEWYFCRVKSCGTRQIMPEEHRVWNNTWVKSPTNPESEHHVAAVYDPQLRPPWE
jgi:hypothetical protein